MLYWGFTGVTGNTALQFIITGGNDFMSIAVFFVNVVLGVYKRYRKYNNAIHYNRRKQFYINSCIFCNCCIGGLQALQKIQ
ncbi:MAG: hypothetical protein JWQ54_588 [Mucilaginibacter sp.]|nr:hypothetical protein [Mucilaginibacter sp.]